MWKDKLVAGSQKAADIYCASHPQWEFIIPALLLGVLIGTILTVGLGWFAVKRLRSFTFGASRSTLT
ncbi:MAG: hypothetical protein EOP83_22170 [Verrucomicrobiaceae bacterium]|nr:MAG: hypothetical protein EOP83_22170 [Verrucomicrobiaceae bacterium]